MALGAALRELRQSSGLSQHQVAQQTGLEKSSIGRWERGDRVPRPEDTATYLAAVHCSPTEREELLSMTRDAAHDDSSWVTTGIPDGAKARAALQRFESLALHITDAEPLLIPGLLQTSEYARAMMSAGGIPATEIEPRLQLRSQRQGILSGATPKALTVFLGAGALDQQIGGPAVMAAQLRQLVELGKRPNIVVRVVPHAAGWTPLLEGSFVLFEFHKGVHIVHLEHHRSSLFLHRQSDVAAYQRAAVSLGTIAMAETTSLDLVADRARTLEATCRESS
ncbi:helix-turn-helix domain-containing protein [Actinoalloteichus hymeniacidonis]|nr:helix-turn-helix transcriptional regulator [Actinoalloteichus hymeniacidonis]